MSRRYFGTDGIRGVFGGPVMNEDFAWRVGRAAGLWLRERLGADALRRVLVGRDTRFSGPALEAALRRGFMETGAEVLSAGVVPTPAVSLGVRSFGLQLGVVVTASHNPADDNGIKFFDARGSKLDDADESAIEAFLDATAVTPDPRTDSTSDSPEILPVEHIYVDRLSALLDPDSLRGWKLVVDAGHGASYRTTPAVLRRLGAEVHLLSAEPDGRNINHACGSQYPEAMQRAIVELGCRLGIAHDGDADRLILCDEAGEIVDGDEILAILAAHALTMNTLRHRTLVATVQSNLGLRRFIEKAGGRLVQTAVGDRYVSEAMEQGGFNLGGESSGHVICTDVSPCGDGLAAALLVLRALLHAGEPLSVLRRKFHRYPQQTRALRVSSKPPIETLAHTASAAAAAEERLGADGRVMIRYSGTEPKIRLLVEGPTDAIVAACIEELERAVRADLP
ncbi:phosphoglucosamine mutase [Opitutales bacterium ASA1]|uniref:phosphoglucosamine mutase n=1 Tax=Congregicoccus parvus TaxID=3081749 RepID=UPI002B2D7288|nr:phosphoglucosamine mutase [Opitutales bacterium ASA1]